MKTLIKAILASSLLFCCNFALAGTRTFILDYAIEGLSPTNKGLDTRSDDPTMSFNGTIVVDDSNNSITRDMTICFLTVKVPCLSHKQYFEIVNYVNGGNAVILRDKADGSMLKVTLVWNYINLGLVEKLGAIWKGSPAFPLLGMDGIVVLTSWKPQ